MRGRMNQIYQVSLAGGESKASSVGLSGLMILADMAGVTNINQAYVGTEVLTNQRLSGVDRWTQGITGVIQLVTTADGAARVPTAVSQIRSLWSRGGGSGAGIGPIVEMAGPEPIPGMKPIVEMAGNELPAGMKPIVEMADPARPLADLRQERRWQK